jgi:3-isopropylmalate/(R)-2-methylmalate dehydratase small subunit
MSKILSVTGRALPLRGDDLDTDRIMPARFLRSVTFEGLEKHLFEDDRNANPAHPFNNPTYAGAEILVVNANFGSGSSREHAPQGLARAGIRAIVGESFSEIFRGNSVMLGIPCFSADRASVNALQSLVEREPATQVETRVDTGLITAGSLSFTATLPPAVRESFLSGQWNPTAMLLDKFEEVREVSDRLPYVAGF